MTITGMCADTRSKPGYPAPARAVEATVQRLLNAATPASSPVLPGTPRSTLPAQNARGVAGAIAVPVDEKTGVQAIGNAAPDLRPMAGEYPTVARDHEYIRSLPWPHNHQPGYPPGPTSHGELTLAHDRLKPNVTRFSILSKLRYSWGRTPVLRPTSKSASSRADMAGSVARRAGPGGPAQTWRSAPQLPQLFPILEKRVALAAAACPT